MTNEKVLELDSITKIYPGVVALDNVSLTLYKGEVLGLIGENGAGKSTLVKTVSGAIKPTSGRIIVNGKEFSQMTPRLSAENGIAVIYQEFNNVQELSVAENMFLGHPIRKGIVIDRAAMNEKTNEIFDELGIKIDPNIKMKNLTVGYQQMVEIGKALLMESNILIMDEPSAPLTSNETENMFEVVKLLQKKGVSIIYISHKLEEIFYLCSRIEVLRDGQYIDSLLTKDSNVDQLIRLMVGREMIRQYPARNIDPEKIDTKNNILEVKNVSGNGVKNISFELKRGEILGLGGLVGAGRTEFAELLFGVKQKDEGSIKFLGKELNLKSPREAIDKGIALVTEDRKRYGLSLHLSIKQNICMPIYKRISKGMTIDSKYEAKCAEEYFQSMRIKATSTNEITRNLSGGNQQKVVIGKWLAADAELIIFDEPTRGIDVGAKQEIYILINKLVESGKSVILISSEMEELMGMSDRIIVLAEGNMTGELKKDEFDADKILAYASNVSRGVKR